MLKVRDREGWGAKVSGEGVVKVWTNPHQEQEDSQLEHTMWQKQGLFG